MPYEFIAITTNAGRKAISHQLVDGEPAIQVVGFSVGEGGYEQADPKTATAPDPNSYQLENQIFPLQGYKEYDAVTWNNEFMPSFICVLEHNEGLGSIGEWGLWAKYVTGPQAGQEFLYAILHSPVIVKTSADRVVTRIYLPF